MSRNDRNRNRLFIGRLNPDARTRDLERFLSDHGFTHIKDINIKLGYAFVEFEDKRDADDAVIELDQKHFFGTRLTVDHAKGTPRDGGRGGRGGRDGGSFRSDNGYRGGGGGRSRDFDGGRQRPYNTDWRIIVTNLSSRVGWQDLKDFFRSAGEVTFTKANKEKIGEGVVEFRTHKEMEKAMKKFDGAEFFDRRIKLIDDSPGPPRSRSRSRSRSKRRSKSRSKSRSRSRSHRRSSKKSPSPKRSKSSSKSKSRSRSKSPANVKSPSRSRSRSKSPQRSPSPEKDDNEN